MDALLFVLVLIAMAGVAAYFVVKWVLLLLLAAIYADKEAREEADAEDDRSVTVHIEITGLPNPPEKDQNQPRQPSTRP